MLNGFKQSILNMAKQTEQKQTIKKYIVQKSTRLKHFIGSLSLDTWDVMKIGEWRLTRAPHSFASIHFVPISNHFDWDCEHKLTLCISTLKKKWLSSHSLSAPKIQLKRTYKLTLSNAHQTKQKHIYKQNRNDFVQFAKMLDLIKNQKLL